MAANNEAPTEAEVLPPESQAERQVIARSAAPPDALTEFGKLDIGIKHATEIANQLKSVIDERGLAVSMGRKEHLMVEAWVTCGMMVGISPKTEWTGEVRNPTTGDLEGYKARVQAIRMANGAVIGAAESSCHFDEQNKKRETGELYERWMEHGRPNRHAAMSMAQTRATSKALAQALRWIPVLAGYSGTPFEEMPPGGVDDGGDSTATKTQAKSNGKKRSGKITEPMAKRAVAIARTQGGKVKPEVHGFDVIADMLALGSMAVQPDGSRYPDLLKHLVDVLPGERYDGFCEAIELYQGPDKPLRGHEPKTQGARETGANDGPNADDRPLEADNPAHPQEPDEEMVPVVGKTGDTRMIPLRCAVEHVDDKTGEIFYTEAPF